MSGVRRKLSGGNHNSVCNSVWRPPRDNECAGLWGSYKAPDVRGQEEAVGWESQLGLALHSGKQAASLDQNECSKFRARVEK